MRHLMFLRKRYFINPKFQLSFIAYNLGTSLILCGVFYGAIRYAFGQLHTLAVEAGLPEDDGIFLFLAEHTHHINKVFGVTFLITVVVLTLLGIYLSHKVAGPLYRFHSHLTRVSRGDEPTPVHFRDGDYFQELAQAYNATLTKPASGDKKKSSKAA